MLPSEYGDVTSSLEALKFGALVMCRILIVDDHQGIRQNIRGLLNSREGWSVCGEAEDGLQAVEQAKQLRPDLILMDVSMPNMNGTDATKIIRRDVSKSLILIMSQNDPAIVRRQTEDANAHGFLAKSAMAHHLIETVERMLLAEGQRKGGKPARKQASSQG
jgi:DNA-binding NarL/FixJ family response regulator